MLIHLQDFVSRESKATWFVEAVRFASATAEERKDLQQVMKAIEPHSA